MAIVQRSKDIFAFSYRILPAQCRWGDDYRMDQLGATSHLSPTIVYDDQNALDWIKRHTSGIKVVSKVNSNFDEMQFLNEEDAVLFKMTWM